MEDTTKLIIIIIGGGFLFSILCFGIFQIAFFVKKKKEPKQEYQSSPENVNWYEYEEDYYCPTSVVYFSRDIRYKKVPDKILRLREGESSEDYVDGVHYRFTCVKTGYEYVGSNYFDESEAYAIEKEGESSTDIYCTYIRVVEV